MLLRIVSLWAILLATQISSADDASAPSAPSIRHEIDATRADQQLLLQQKCAELDRLQTEIKQLREATGTAQQIAVKVQMLEVSLTKLRKMGVDTDWFASGCISGTRMQRLLDAIGVRAELSAVDPAETELNDYLLFVKWLKRNNAAKVLAEPSLVAVSGQAASFKIGSEIPVPASKDS